VGADVIIIGGGIVGAACAFFATRAGLTVTLLERSAVAAGTTGAGEGNILVSDKEPGAELDLALRSLHLWDQLATELGAESFELERKGGLVVAPDEATRVALAEVASKQNQLGIQATAADPVQLTELEPYLRPGLAGGVFYPQDLQVQPMLAAARLLEAAVQRGATLRLGHAVTGLLTEHGRITGVQTTGGSVRGDWVVNAAGTWAGELSRALGAEVPVLPRRGFILVTEPLPPLIRHKVYSADYVANVASSSEGLETSCVVEGTAAGPVLIGASRERVGFDRTLSVPVLRTLARQAVDLFPVLAGVSVIRAYRGFRPYCPDHLPVIGHDPRVPGLLHACGHEGAGIGLAPATGELIAQLIASEPPSLSPGPYSPERFLAVPA
jgi:glycine/D-amino acid oxidase-like deaminating enzyme